MPHSVTVSPLRQTWLRLRRKSVFWVGAIGFGLACLGSVIAPVLAPDPTPLANRQLVAAALQPPGTQLAVYLPQPDAQPLLLTTTPGGYRLPDGHVLPATDATVQQWVYWLGSDTLGRDVLSRLLHGGRTSLLVGLLSVLVSVLVGVSVGLWAGYRGGRVDAVLQWCMTVLWSLPAVLLALVIAFALGRGLGTLVIAIGLTTWVDLARVVRGQVLSLREREFAWAARGMGFGTARVLVRHLLPQLWGPLVLLAVSNYATAVLLEAGLSFLGLGVPLPTPSWGGMVYEGYQYIPLSGGKWLAIFPGLAIVWCILSLNLIALGLRDALDARAER